MPQSDRPKSLIERVAEHYGLHASLGSAPPEASPRHEGHRIGAVPQAMRPDYERSEEGPRSMSEALEMRLAALREGGIGGDGADPFNGDVSNARNESSGDH